MAERPLFPELEVWTKKGTRRAFKQALLAELAGVSDDELKAMAAVVMGKVTGDIARVLIERAALVLPWIAYAEALARRFR